MHMFRSALLLLVITIVLTSVFSMKTNHSRALLHRITNSSLESSDASDMSMCQCTYGCYKGNDPVDDTFYVHCRHSDEGKPCADDYVCEMYCKDCCLEYGFEENADKPVCAKNIAGCMAPIPP